MEWPGGDVSVFRRAQFKKQTAERLYAFLSNQNDDFTDVELKFTPDPTLEGYPVIQTDQTKVTYTQKDDKLKSTYNGPKKLIFYKELDLNRILRNNWKSVTIERIRDDDNGDFVFLVSGEIGDNKSGGETVESAFVDLCQK